MSSDATPRTPWAGWHAAGFWIAFAILSAVALAFAWRYFPQALPLLDLDVTMTREDASTEAARLATRFKLEPSDGQRAVRFAHDGDVQNFVELEAGGKPAFKALLAGKSYSPYWWDVRLFKPGAITEALVRFRPDGTAYGFYQRVPESEAGPALALDAARTLAEERARIDWGIDFQGYKFLEHSQLARPNGRVDHSFVYERTDETLGAGRYRLRLVVSGDRATELTHYVFVPEAFARRYAEMRAANNTIAQVATLSAGAMYGIGGCILGVLWLLRRRWLQWKPALVAGLTVSAMVALAVAASSPAAWFNYDTAQSTATFWGQQLGSVALAFIGGGLALAVVFMAAESLSRVAFPDHPQFWRLWSLQAAPTREVLGRTVGAYLFVPIELAFVAAFYYVTNRYLGWWQPSETLTNPDVLASAFPALGPIAMSLQAGFMEESLFRAVPLAIAAIIGGRIGHRKLCIGLALVLQAVVFGAAHANYPGFPSYSRLVELVLPAFIWGLIFLRFGLLTTAILHALFDLTLFSIPLFLIEGPGSTLNQSLVIAAAMVPLGIVLARRWRAGEWLSFPIALRNAGWAPAAGRDAEVSMRVSAVAGNWTKWVQRLLPVLGLAGLIAIVQFGDFEPDAPPLRITRDQAESAADAALRERGVTLGPEWRRSSSIRLASGNPGAWLAHKFVWREGGAAIYGSLLGKWLDPPLWQVRYARFAGADVADRAEEWYVAVAGDGVVRELRHQLPEARAGESLSKDDARRIAIDELQRRFGLDARELREVGASESERPSRRDWLFSYTDPRVAVSRAEVAAAGTELAQSPIEGSGGRSNSSNSSGGRSNSSGGGRSNSSNSSDSGSNSSGTGGEARAAVAIAGREVTDSGRYVFVPEAWQREEREKNGRFSTAKIVFGILGFVVGVAALIALIVAWSRGRFDRRAFWLTGIVVGVTSLVSAVNQWPVAATQLKTSEPLTLQIGVLCGTVLLGVVTFALFAGLLAGVASRSVRAHSEPGLGMKQLAWRGVCAGLFALGVDLLVAGLTPDSTPTWPSYRAENGWLPALESIVVTLSSGIFLIAVSIVILDWLDRLTAGWTRRRVLAFALLALIGAAAAAFKTDHWSAVVAAGLIDGAVTTMLFATVLRFDLRVVPAFVAVTLIANAVGDALLKRTGNAALLDGLAVFAAIVLAWFATRYLLARSAEGAPPSAGNATAHASAAARPG